MTPEVWREHARWWVPAVLFLVVNAILLLSFRVAVGARIGLRDARLESSEAELARLELRMGELETRLVAAETAARQIADLKDGRLGSREGRLTAVMLRVKDLARQAGFGSPPAISYPEQEVAAYGLEKLSFVFTISGSYAELRQLINLLELSDSYLSLEAIRVSDPGQGPLTIQLTLSTLFASPDAEPQESA